MVATLQNDDAGTVTLLNVPKNQYVNVLDYGAKGDGHTDDTLAIQNAINAAIVSTAGKNGPGMVYFPSQGRYSGYCFSSVACNGDVHLVGARPGDGSLDFGSVLVCNQLTTHGFTMNSTTWGFENLIFRYFAGWGGNVLSATTSTITFDTLVTPDLTTLQAPTLQASFTLLVKYGYYSDGTDVFRFLGTTNTTIGAGGTFPTISSCPNDGADHTVSGLPWHYVSHGTTYNAGDFGWGQQWYYFGSTANSITGVVPAPGQLTYTDPTGVNITNIGRGYFASLQFNSTTVRSTIAMINGAVGQDPVLKNCWFNGMAGVSVLRSASMQGGIWTENVFDNAQYGVYGDLTNMKLTNNRFFGCKQAAIFTASTPAIGVGGAQISDNYFQLNGGTASIVLDDGGVYTSAAVTGSAIAGIVIRNNYSNQDLSFLWARGVAHMTVEGNRISRTGQTVIALTNVNYSRIVNNHIDGCGEAPVSSAALYEYIREPNASATFASNFIVGNSFTYLNAAQHSDYGIAIQVTGTATNTIQQNQFYLTGVTLLVSNYSPLAQGTLPIFANNAAALAGGLTPGLMYRTNGDPDTICIVH
jgi:hypothetical protein